MSMKKGFTLIELLIVITIIAILATATFVALDPLTRFRDSRDSRRWSDVVAIADAIKLDQTDNGGYFLPAIGAMTIGEVYMIGSDVTGCNGYTCDVTVQSGTHCVNLSGLVTDGYLGAVPVSPNGAGSSWTSGHTGYTLELISASTTAVQACESENTSQIRILR